MLIKEVVDALERFAPLPLQDGYDNAGMQVGLTEVEVTGALLCLDVTEQIIDEAVDRGCNMIVSHHPLLFHAPKRYVGATYVERCVMKAIRKGVAVYSAHTNLDNARGGVSFRMAEKLGLTGVETLSTGAVDGAGAGVIGNLPAKVGAEEFLRRVKQVFGAGCVQHTEACGRMVQRVALCGGAGAFLVSEAVSKGADVFVTGEAGYHEFFGHEDQMITAVIGHYESERFTDEILYSIIHEACPDLRLCNTALNTNPIKYL